MTPIAGRPSGTIPLGSVLLALLAASIFVLDQASKRAVMRSLPEDGTPIRILPFLDIRHVQNTGVAFGMLSGRVSLVLVATVLVAALLMYFLAQMPATGRLTLVGASLIAGGAAGNLADRVRHGYVVDFINVPHWPTFNVADIAIVCGVAAVLWSQRGHGSAPAPDEASPAQAPAPEERDGADSR